MARAPHPRRAKQPERGRRVPADDRVAAPVPVSMRSRKPKGAQRALRAAAFALIGVVAIVLVAVVLAGGWYLQGAPELAEPVTVEIPSGATTQRIAEILTEAGVVSDPLHFRLKARMKGVDGDFKPGTFTIEDASIDKLFAQLVAGPPIDYVDVTIPEGFTVEEIAARIEAKTGIHSAEFLQYAESGAEGYVATRPYLAGAYEGKLEGYLFPKTYRILKGATAAEVVDVMLDQFEAEFATVDLTWANANGLSTQDIVIIASMIERETMVDTERPLVSSVIQNRIDLGMRLQIDATIEYVIASRQVRLNYDDLQIDTPYNTYRNGGLPPGPISNPGLASLQAAANPAQTDYLYYVLTSKDGSHTFTTNEADHIAAKAISKQVFGQ